MINIRWLHNVRGCVLDCDRDGVFKRGHISLSITLVLNLLKYTDLSKGNKTKVNL